VIFFDLRDKVIKALADSTQDAACALAFYLIQQSYTFIIVGSGLSKRI